MEFPTLGQQCKNQDCKHLDFLPIMCSFCKESFCKDHFQPGDHSCPSYTSTEPTSLSTSESFPCTFQSCPQKELVKIPCPHCELHFCLQHRHQVDHNCSKLVKPEEKMKQTAAVVKEIVEKNAEKKQVKQGAKSDKLAAKVQLMKLKQSAKGISELPAEERIYFLVKTPSDKDTAVYVSKFWSVGKSIDYMATVANVPNYNNFYGKPKLNLFTHSGVCLSEQKDVILKDMIEKETIFNGQSIALKYV